MAKFGIAATVNPDTLDHIKEVMEKSGRGKSAAIEMLLDKGFEVWRNERIARAYQAGNKDE